MTESTRTFFETLVKVLLGCWALGFAVLFVWVGAVLLMGELMHKIHGPMFGVSNHELDVILYCGMGIWKLIALAFYFVPWLAIRMVLKNAKQTDKLSASTLP